MRKLDYFNIAGIIVTEHSGTTLNAAHAERTWTYINIRSLHFIYFLELIINYSGITLQDLFGLRIKLVSNLVDMVLVPAIPALQADFSAHP